MRAVVTGGIGGVVDTFGKSLKYATCFGKFTVLKVRGSRSEGLGSLILRIHLISQSSRSFLVSYNNVSSNDGLYNWNKFIFK